jgi:hypothetical protein
MKIMFSLIHNNDVNRNLAMKATLDSLISSLPKGVDFIVQRFGWQPKDISISFIERISRAYENAKTGFVWEFYSARPSVAGWLRALPKACATLIIYLLREVPHSMVGNQSGARHLQVSRKHFLAWSYFLESDSTHLIVLEDDALLLDGGGSRFTNFIGEMEQTSDRNLFFALLSSGFPASELGLQHLDGLQIGRDTYSVSKPYVNGAAGYVINTVMAEEFTGTISQSPRLLNNTIDFMMNRIFIMGERKTRDTFLCLHFTRPIVDNASLSGSYNSSIS